MVEITWNLAQGVLEHLILLEFKLKWPILHLRQVRRTSRKQSHFYGGHLHMVAEVGIKGVMLTEFIEKINLDFQGTLIKGYIEDGRCPHKGNLHEVKLAHKYL